MNEKNGRDRKEQKKVTFTSFEAHQIQNNNNNNRVKAMYNMLESVVAAVEIQKFHVMSLRGLG